MVSPIALGSNQDRPISRLLCVVELEDSWVVYCNEGIFSIAEGTEV